MTPKQLALLPLPLVLCACVAHAATPPLAMALGDSAPDGAQADVVGAEAAAADEGAAALTGSASSADGNEMYRLYNPNSGEHFYTASTKESGDLQKLGWRFEGVGWVSPEASETPVFRLYNRYSGDHHYTTSETERKTLVKQGWVYEGVGWYSDDAKTVAVYRQYNPNALSGTHNYTTSKAENDGLVGMGWKAEGVGWYAVAEAPKQIVHFTGADFAFPEAWYGRMSTYYSYRRYTGGFEETINYDGAHLLDWNPKVAEQLDDWRRNPHPTDYADLATETLDDGTILMFGVTNYTNLSVEIIDPYGHKGLLGTYVTDDFFISIARWSDSKVAEYRLLQADAAGVPLTESPLDIAIAFLRACATRITMTD